MKADFHFDEFRHVGVDFADAAQVAAYEAKQGTRPEADVALLDRLGVSSGDVLLDIGCGTGLLARQASLRGVQVSAVDISEVMLDYARGEAREAGCGNIAFMHAGFLSFEIEARSVDFVTSKAALHHLPDFWKAAALQRIYDTLKPGGIFYLWDVVFSFDPGDYEEEVRNWIESSGREDGKGFSKAEFAMHVREEYSTYAWVLEGLLKRAGFEIVERAYPRPVIGEYVCRKP